MSCLARALHSVPRLFAFASAACIAAAACGGDGSTSGASSGSGGEPGAGGGASKNGGSGPGGAGGSGAGATTTASNGGAPPSVSEKEPNNGDPIDQVDQLSTDTKLAGAIGEPGDVDVFFVDTTPGKFYRVTLGLPVGSKLVGHLTVIDSGRNGEAPAHDYVRLSSTPVEEPTLTFPAMGEGDHYVAVRDLRELAGSPSGSADHAYNLRIEELAEDDVLGEPASFPGTVKGSLRHPGALVAHPFTSAKGKNVVVDLSTPGTLDARLFIVATATNDWIARNDDRSGGGKDPLIDGPLTESGPAWIVVESAGEEASSLDYTLKLSSP